MVGLLSVTKVDDTTHRLQDVMIGKVFYVQSTLTRLKLWARKLVYNP